jgi:hypothetical protein
MYWEPQTSDNCRVHALNALFQGPAVTPASLVAYTREFDAFYNITVNSLGIGTQGYEAVQSDGRTLLSFVIETIDPRAVTYYVPINSVPAALARFKVQGIEDLSIPSCLVFSSDHVWCCRRDKADPTTWWNLDSSSGLRQINRVLPRPNDRGAILVFSKPAAKAHVLPVLKQELAAALKRAPDMLNGHHPDWPALVESIETLVFTYRRLKVQCDLDQPAPNVSRLTSLSQLHAILKEVFDCV